MVNDILLGAAAWASALRSTMVSRMRDERGQDLIEYAVLGGAIALVAAIAIVAAPLNTPINDFVGKVGDCIKLDANCT